MIGVEHSRVVLPRLGARAASPSRPRPPQGGEVQVSVGADFAEQQHHAGPRAAIDSNQAEARDRSKTRPDSTRDEDDPGQLDPALQLPDDHHDWPRRLQAEPAKRGHELAGLVRVRLWPSQSRPRSEARGA